MGELVDIVAYKRQKMVRDFHYFVKVALADKERPHDDLVIAHALIDNGHTHLQTDWTK